MGTGGSSSGASAGGRRRGDASSELSDSRDGSSMLAAMDEENEGRGDDAPPLPMWGSELCVLVLNREDVCGCCCCCCGAPLPNEMVLSRVLPLPLPRIMLCRAVRCSTFFSVKGKYSVRWFVMSSLGGRCPKKLRSFEGRREAACDAMLCEGVSCDVGVVDDDADVVVVAVVGDDGGSSAFSGSRTPSPLRMLIELARFVLFGVCPR
jgi:hypothetical protein